MTDSSEDFLGLTDAAERRLAQGPAMITGEPLGPFELAALEEMSRKDTDPNAGLVVFTSTSEDGVETLDQPLVWQRVMRWPRPPTVEEVEAWQANARAARRARWWDRLAAARARDEEAARPVRAAKPGGATK
ncbi:MULTISPECIES: hypothetical protein [Bradyrhizobium]|uniref:Uncharacterized protein n=2 Tax=Bradyrhizobium TaxID=374 RepID=A0ABY0PMB7_9BRAD|nr:MULTISPECIES: hypothetical protein [Bradyrhizobium]SDI54668.1 hypothetical protein SAMN05444163_3091 [Bradyrhizobium ottawaense]SED42726.1 hypothetical protein SAMN05444171_4078 [Bradyrhizobium lablabi]